MPRNRGTVSTKEFETRGTLGLPVMIRREKTKNAIAKNPSDSKLCLPTYIIYIIYHLHLESRRTEKNAHYKVSALYIGPILMEDLLN